MSFRNPRPVTWERSDVQMTGGVWGWILDNSLIIGSALCCMPALLIAIFIMAVM